LQVFDSLLARIQGIDLGAQVGDVADLRVQLGGFLDRKSVV
jgi:hypothetical protein